MLAGAVHTTGEYLNFFQTLMVRGLQSPDLKECTLSLWKALFYHYLIGAGEEPGSAFKVFLKISKSTPSLLHIEDIFDSVFNRAALYILW